MQRRKAKRLELIKARYRELILEPRQQREQEMHQDAHESHREQDAWAARLLHKHAIDDKLENELD